MIHTPGKLAYQESPYEPNLFTVHANGKWLMSIVHNGETLMETQRENMRRLAACWNACEGSNTGWLEFQNDPDRVDQFGESEPFETRYTAELQKAVKIMEQRDRLLQPCQELIAFLDKNPPMGESIWAVRQIREAVASIVPPAKESLADQRIPENCGSGHCSCIECLAPRPAVTHVPPDDTEGGAL